MAIANTFSNHSREVASLGVLVGGIDTNNILDDVFVYVEND